MAYRRCITEKAKLLHHQQQRFTPSFSYINHNDDNNSTNAQPPNHPSSRSFSTIDGSNTRFQGFQGCPSRSFGTIDGPDTRFQGLQGSPSRSFGTINGSNIRFQGIRGSPFRYAALGYSGGRNMSTTSGGDPGEKVDMLSNVDVLLDGSVENVTAQVAQVAPEVNEVALAAADSFFPIANLQYFIEYVHVTTGLNWWASIAATTFLIRLLLVPMSVNQLKATSKFTLLRPKLEEVKQEMQDRGMDPAAVSEGQEKMKQLFKEYKVTPFTPLKGVLLQGPLFICFFLAIKNMAEHVPSFQHGGAYWFVDLTTPDTMYILPVLTALTFWFTVEFNMQDGMEGNPAVKTIKNVSRVFAALTVPLTASFAKAIFCYWISANVFSLMYGAVIKNKTVKQLLGVPLIPVPPPSPNSQSSGLSLSEAYKKYVEAKAHEKRLEMIEEARQQALDSVSKAEASKDMNQKIPPSTILSQRIKSLEKEVKGRKKEAKQKL